MLSAVIPALNAAATLPATLESLTGADEIVLADGGSGDATVSVAEGAGARLVSSPPGRGRQLIAGAAAARGDWLLFLHADTRLAPEWRRAVDSFIADPANLVRGAVFTFALDDDSPAAKRLAWSVNRRTDWFGLPYGDQGLLISRAFYDSLGGYRPFPLFEDVDLVRRIGGKRLTRLPVRAVTSAEAFRRDGYLRRSVRNLTLLARYLAGASPESLAEEYRR